MKTISFNIEGRDYFIDFLKAYAILCVLFAHTFPFLQEVGYGLWAGMQVPIFLLVQSFHALKANKKLNFNKVFRRIFIPFLLAQLLITTIKGCKDGFDNALILNCINGGGTDQEHIILGYTYSLPL